MQVADLFARLSIKPDKASFAAADRALDSIKKVVLGIVAIKSAQWFAGLVQQTAEAGGKLDDLSQQLGVSAENLQRLGHAATMNGSDLDTVSGSLQKLAMNADAASKGSKEQAAAFRKVGLNAKDVAAGVVPLDDALAQIADHLAAMPDGAAKSNLAIDLLGKSAGPLIPLLNGGADGIRRLGDELEASGGLIRNDAVASLAEFGDEQDALRRQLLGLRDTAVVAVLPTIREMVRSLSTWVAANRKLLAQKLAFVFKGIAGAIKLIATVVGGAVSALQWLARHLEIVTIGVVSLTLAMAVYKAGSVSAALASANAALVAAAAWGKMMLAVLPMAALFGLIFLVVDDLWMAFTGGKSIIKDVALAFMDWFGNTKVGKVLMAVLGFVGKILSGLMDIGKELGSSAFDRFASEDRKRQEMHNQAAAAANKRSQDREDSVYASYGLEAGDTDGLARARAKEAGIAVDERKAGWQHDVGIQYRKWRRQQAAQPDPMFTPERPLASMPSQVGGTTIGDTTVSVVVNAKTDADPQEIGRVAARALDDQLRHAAPTRSV